MQLAKKFDFLVIGGGSGGNGAARRATAMGKNVCLIEHKRMGGTCVNVGCVPKKVTYNLAAFIEDFHHLSSKGVIQGTIKHSWSQMKILRDNYILFLNKIYEKNYEKEKIELVKGFANFVSPNTIQVGEQYYTSSHILIATGSYPSMPSNIQIPGIEMAKHSDHFFDLEKQPSSVMIIGSGYISVELAGIFNALGTKTHLSCRRDRLLTNFDNEVAYKITEVYKKNGVNLMTNTNLKKIEISPENDKLKRVYFMDDSFEDVEEVFLAIGRLPDTNRMNIESTQLKLDQTGHVIVDEFCNTSVNGIYAIGDCIGKVQLTPVAIREGRILSERLFNGQTMLKMDYDNVGSVVFSHPPIATCGLTEEEAIKMYGEDDIEVHRSNFRDMWYAMVDEDLKQPSFFKMITVKSLQGKIIGCHL